MGRSKGQEDRFTQHIYFINIFVTGNTCQETKDKKMELGWKILKAVLMLLAVAPGLLDGC